MSVDVALDSPKGSPPLTEEFDAPPVTRARGRRPTRSQLLGLLSLVAISVLPVPFGDFGYFIGQYATIYAILGLSVVVVTGYAGLISLMPYSFAGIGAMATGVAMASWGWPFWLAVPFAAVATVPFALVVGVTSVRLKGLYLAIATLTISNALGETFFTWTPVTGGDSGHFVDRPVVGPVDFAGDLAFYALCLGAVFILMFMVEGLRTSRMGRAMLAVRDNELEAQALGINVAKTKLVAFVLSGMIAGLGGAFLAQLLISVTPNAFQSPFAEASSLLLVTLVAIGGMDRAIGAFVGAIALVVQQQIFNGFEFFFAFVGIYAAVTLIAFLLFRPGGLVQVGKLLAALTRARPALGLTIIAIILVTNIGGAWLILSLS